MLFRRCNSAAAPRTPRSMILQCVPLKGAKGEHIVACLCCAFVLTASFSIKAGGCRPPHPPLQQFALLFTRGSGGRTQHMVHNAYNTHILGATHTKAQNKFGARTHSVPYICSISGGLDTVSVLQRIGKEGGG